MELPFEKRVLVLDEYFASLSGGVPGDGPAFSNGGTALAEAGA